MNLRIFFTLAFAGCLASASLAQNAVEAFSKAVEFDQPNEIKRLVARGVDPNSPNLNGDIALHVASRNGALGSVRALLESRAKVNLRNRFGDSAIMMAALGGHLGVVKLLREKGADINHPGWTPLAYAATTGHLDVVKYLLEQGADPSARAVNGITSVMMAVREYKDDVLRELLDYGADPNQKNDKGETALKWAEDREQKSSIEILKKAGAK